MKTANCSNRCCGVGKKGISGGVFDDETDKLMADGVECANEGCREPLSKEYAGENSSRPCPKCGDTNGRRLSLSAQARTSSWAAGNPTHKHGHTGREVTGSNGVADANQWADVADRRGLLAHPGSAYFGKMVASAPPVPGRVLQLFRGQRIADTEAKPPSIDRMGPPRIDGNASEGRYNRAGEQVLYLTSSKEGARRESERFAGQLYLIRFDVPLRSIRIADFTAGPSDGFVTAAFARAEICNLTKRGGPANYIFSQVVAELVSALWDGMRIPGVRGEPGAHYANVVLFRHFEQWQDWVVGEGGPYPFGAASGATAVPAQ